MGGSGPEVDKVWMTREEGCQVSVKLMVVFVCWERMSPHFGSVSRSSGVMAFLRLSADESMMWEIVITEGGGWQ